MMTTTHALVGMLIGTTSLTWNPSLLTHTVVAGLIGGIIPDLDLIFEHRKTLHMPIYYTLGAVISIPVLLHSPSIISAFTAYLFFSLSIHTTLDIISGGLAPKRHKHPQPYPIYDHFRGKWISKKVIRYDGSPEDITVNITVGALVIFLLNGYFQFIAVLLILISLSYFFFRMRWHRFSLKALDIEEQA